MLLVDVCQFMIICVYIDVLYVYIYIHSSNDISLKFRRDNWKNDRKSPWFGSQFVDGEKCFNTMFTADLRRCVPGF